MGDIDKFEQSRKLSYLISSLVTILNIILIINDLSVLWGINLHFYIKHPKITRKLLLKYEYYIRILITIGFTLMLIDNQIYNYYKRKGYSVPRTYGIFLSSILFFIFILGYYVYQLFSFIYFAFLCMCSLTYYLTIRSPYEENIEKSKFIKVKE